MRDFNFKSEADTSPANVAGVRSDMVQPAIVQSQGIEPVLLRDDIKQDTTEPLRPFHIERDEEESNNLPKLAAAAIIGILIVGGGIYAYDTTAQQPSVKTVAMNSTAPAKVATTGPAAPAPMPAPDGNAQSQPAPASTPGVVERAGNTAPVAAPVKSADNTAPASSSASSDPAINAPMTLTPDNAPPPEGSQTAQAAQPQTAQSAPVQAAPAQTAMQQPLTAPNVSDASSQPAPEVATNNGASTAPAETTAPATDSQPQPATIQPQVQPQVQPQLQPQLPAQQ